jgi:hypothetical protein
MNLHKFFEFHQKSGYLTELLEGVEFSTFAEKNTNISDFVRKIMSALGGTNVGVMNQTQSGGLTIRPSKESDKKQSFSTEFNQLINNVLSLIGYELSKYLFHLFGMKMIMKRTFQELKSAETQEKFVDIVKQLKNMAMLSSSLSSLTNDFMTAKQIQLPPFVKQDAFLADKFEETPGANYKYKYSSSLYNSSKEDYFDSIIANPRTAQLPELESFINELEIGEYTINSVDELCINLGEYGIGYDRSFIKQFEILYKESFADVPFDLWNSYKPYYRYITEELKLESCNNFVTNLIKYFQRIYKETLESLAEFEDLLKVNVTNFMYEYLADITLNLFAILGKNISLNQSSAFCFGKSTRIQFIQVYVAMLYCAPRFMDFTPRQNVVLHYFLLTKKTLQESLGIFMPPENTE